MPQAALRELLGIAGLDGEAEIRGADPVLKTPYRVGTAGAASLAATGIAASSCGNCAAAVPSASVWICARLRLR
jgi:hypothetical protein